MTMLGMVMEPKAAARLEVIVLGVGVGVVVEVVGGEGVVVDLGRVGMLLVALGE